MMHISDLWVVSMLDKRLREKRIDRNKIAEGTALGVTIEGKYQPDDLLDAVRPIILAHLDAEIAVLISDLTARGVDMTNIG